MNKNEILEEQRKIKLAEVKLNQQKYEKNKKNKKYKKKEKCC